LQSIADSTGEENDCLQRAYRETTEKLSLSQNTPRQEQKSSLCTSSQSTSTLTTLLKDSFIDIKAFPATKPHFNPSLSIQETLKTIKKNEFPSFLIRQNNLLNKSQTRENL